MHVFEGAEKARQYGDSIPLQPLRRVASFADVETYIAGPVQRWLKLRLEAATEADQGYTAVMQQACSAERRVTAAVQSARNWASFIARSRSAPYPRNWDRSGFSPYRHNSGTPLLWAEVRAHFYATLDQLSEPVGRKAKVAMERCLALAVEEQIFDQDTLGCIEWLTKNYPDQYPLVDELYDARMRPGPSGIELPRALADPRETASR